MGAYETWLEAKKRLDATKHEDEREWLGQTVRHLQPAALEDYLEEFVRSNMDMYEDAVALDDDGVRTFLAVLDEIRGTPAKGEVEKTRSAMRSLADDALAKLSRLNYTGAHTHFEVIEDAQLVLNEVLHGRAFPVLERFRCPSVYQGGDLTVPVRCINQLPHEDPHLWRDAHGVAETWRDEQSVNPPKPYDDPNRCQSLSAGSAERCILVRDHIGRHSSGGDGPLSWPNAEELSGHPVRSDDGQCGAAYTGGPPADVQRVCVRAKRHAGLHRDETGARWPQEGSGA